MDYSQVPQKDRATFDSYIVALEVLVTKLEAAGEGAKAMEKEMSAYLVSFTLI